jgi:hypothetical protein
MGSLKMGLWTMGLWTMVERLVVDESSLNSLTWSFRSSEHIANRQLNS